MSKRASCREIESVIGESPFEFKEMVVHILCHVCTSQVNGKTKVIDVLRLRTVNRTFHEQIDTSLLLWRFIVRCTRRGMIEPPLPIPSNTIEEMKKFISLENKELAQRDYLIRSRPLYQRCWLFCVDPYKFDYREVHNAYARYHTIMKLRGEKEHDRDIRRHCATMINLGKLLRQ